MVNVPAAKDSMLGWLIYEKRCACPFVWLAKLTRDLFHEDISLPKTERFFKQTADSHVLTEELLLSRILQSPAIQVDETKIFSKRGTAKND